MPCINCGTKLAPLFGRRGRTALRVTHQCARQSKTCFNRECLKFLWDPIYHTASINNTVLHCWRPISPPWPASSLYAQKRLRALFLKMAQHWHQMVRCFKHTLCAWFSLWWGLLLFYQKKTTVVPRFVVHQRNIDAWLNIQCVVDDSLEFLTVYRQNKMMLTNNRHARS